MLSMKTRIQKWRSLTQAGFFILFIIAPPLNIFRYDLTEGHFFLLGFNWTLQLDALPADDSSAAFRVLFLGLLPIFTIAVVFLFVAWRWGRLYCGWLCPHFSVVEIINKLMIRASGKPSLWEKKKLPERQSDQTIKKQNRLYWLPTLFAVVSFGFVWATGLLTYLLPPFEIYSNLLHAELTRNQALFIGVATLLFCIEFTFARHLFCRFGCAVGLFQSLAWMANKKAMVISFDTSRATACKNCNNACDNVCPMRLQPRTIKRKMFTCTECGECISACTQVQQFNKDSSLLNWVAGEEAACISETPISSSRVGSVKLTGSSAFNPDTGSK
jgi:polyferredoxin